MQSRRLRSLRFVFLSFLIILGLWIVVFQLSSPHYSLHQGQTRKRTVRMPLNRTIDWNISSLSTARSTILPYGARVACWPSNGGLWIKHVPPVELDYLFLSRTHDTPRPIPPKELFWPMPGFVLSEADIEINKGYPLPEAPPDVSEEDLFCQILRTVGASFWEIPTEMILRGIPIEYVVQPKYRNQLAFWWERWAEDTSLVNLTDSRLRLGDQKFNKYVKRYNNVQSMVDRREIMKSLGAIDCSVSDSRNPVGEEECKRMWCAQYLDHCDEMDWRVGIFNNYYTIWTGYNWKGRAGADQPVKIDDLWELRSRFSD